MKDNFVDALIHVLKHEGGYVHHKLDPGGRTCLGVTQLVWEEWCGRESNEKEMRSLTPEMVAPLYRKKYWDKVNGDSLPDGLDYSVFDFAVNSGPGRAAKFLQELIGIKTDGFIGPMTLAALNNKPIDELVKSYNAKRQSFLEELPKFKTFGKGWSRRVVSVTTESLSMIV
jgi:lysozyme family protein